MTRTNTTKLSLVKAVVGSAEQWSTDELLNDNWDKVDEAVGALHCTSTTRPVAPFSGQKIFETDTKALGTWNSSNNRWELVDTSFQAYTPVWTNTAGGSPTVGTAGYIKGRYKRTGKITKVLIAVKLGTSGFTGGTAGGDWDFSLPFIASTIHTADEQIMNTVGTVWVRKTSSGTWETGSARITTDRLKIGGLADGESSVVGVSVGWGAGGRINFVLEYEAA